MAKGADVHAVDIYSKSPLHQATLLGHYNIVKYLVEKANAKVNQISELGKTTLVMAIEQGHLNIALYLLDHSAGTSSLLKCFFLSIVVNFSIQFLLFH